MIDIDYFNEIKLLYTGIKMIVYEVSLTIDSEIYSLFEAWLKEHVKEMLKFPGFIKASILKLENPDDSGQEQLIVHYLIENREFLDVYLAQFAASMRDDAIKRFKDKFSAERKIFIVQHEIEQASLIA